MKKLILILFIAAAAVINAQPEFSDINSRVGAFSRLGFGARGIGMGNAMSAVTSGELVSYYNPALSSFQEGNSFQTSYSFLSLDRSLNFVNFTRQFKLGRKKSDNADEDKPRSIAGVSFGIINSGVSKIDGRDSQGNQTGELSTSENQFFLALSNRFSEKFALGIAFKFYYYKLYENLKASSLGFDIGALYLVNKNITVSFMISDLNAKYRWDSSELYSAQGRITEDKFPISKKIGVAYNFDDPKVLASVEFENTNAGVNYLRFGAEYNIYEGFYIRGGLDKFSISNSDLPSRPAFGFTYKTILSSYAVGFNYAFAIEPYSSSDAHIIGVNINF